jgi:calcineurin-like phosphoesterase family protein
MFCAWERLVGPDEDILHLGDLILAGRGNPGIYDRVKALPGRKCLVRGNHDRHGKGWFAALGFEVIPPPLVRLHGWPPILCSHRPLRTDDPTMRDIGINIHCHIHHKTLDWPPSRVRYINASVEQTEYAPVRLWSLLRCCA